MKTLEDLRGVVADSILVRAVDTSARLTDLGVPHMLIGGVAVGLHGYPRATKDVDFLVGPEAFKPSPILVYRDDVGEIARVGFTDLNPPGKYPLLDQELRVGHLAVVSLNGLLLMKLDAWRPQDQRDVIMLLGVQPEALDDALVYLQEAVPERAQRSILRNRLLEVAQPT